MGKKHKDKKRKKDAKKQLKSFLRVHLYPRPKNNISTEEIAECYRDQLPD